MVTNIVQKRISFSINIRVRTVSVHSMSSWNILQCKWNDSSEKLRCRHVLHSHKRQHRKIGGSRRLKFNVSKPAAEAKAAAEEKSSIESQAAPLASS